jgi:hypothetical protein
LEGSEAALSAHNVRGVGCEVFVALTSRLKLFRRLRAEQEPT